MRTLALRNGDLMLAGDRYAMVEGVARVQQSMALCLREPYGSDRFHPSWGSVMHDWIGRLIDPTLREEVRLEIIRVVKNFIISQNNIVRRYTNEGYAPPVTAEEMIADLTDVSVRQEQDQIMIRVTLKTMGLREFTIMTGPGGP